MGTGSFDGPSVLLEGVRGEHEHHNQQKNDEEEDKGWFAILLLQLVQPYAATVPAEAKGILHNIIDIAEKFSPFARLPEMKIFLQL